MGDNIQKENAFYLVEVAWEVCSQLGGIYTVLRSKAPVITEQMGERYCMLGPYDPHFADSEFDELNSDNIFSEACRLLKKEKDITAKFGRRLVSGRPFAVLIDLNSMRNKLETCKYFLWKDHQIESANDGEVDSVILFGYAVYEYFNILSRLIDTSDQAEKLPIIAHFHEWMAGAAIPVLNKNKTPVKKVFTTHATILGRYLASADSNFYENLERIDAHAAAASMAIYPRYAIERAAAWGADCFTTVSDITGKEAEYLLGKNPDFLLPNGLNINRFTALHEFQNLHQKYKQMINDFVMGHFFPHYTFDLNSTLYFFTSGRYEYKNKGYDLFLEALARLNWKLKSENIPITIVVFIITKAEVRGINVESLKSQAMFDELKNVCYTLSEQIKISLLDYTARGGMPSMEELIDEYGRLRIRRIQNAWKKQGWPSICTHDMVFDGEDPVLNQLRTANLVNSPHDPVKVIFHPEFLTATNPLLGMDYDHFVRGCHLGVFPSYYEPWGYTPMECAAFGVPSATSDLSGFGSYIQKELEDLDSFGLFVIKRKNRSFHESAEQLANTMLEVAKMTRRERIDLRNRVESESVMFDWNEMIKNYNIVYNSLLLA